MPAMRNMIWGLVALLGVQLLLVVLVIFVPSQGPDDGLRGAPVFALDGVALDQVVIEAGDGAVVTLNRDGDTWTIAEVAGFAADSDAVGRMLDAFVALRRGPPVGTTDDARKRFKVDDDQFERRIKLSAGGDVVATALLGTSAGASSSHLRLVNEQEIFSVDFGLFDAPAGTDDWLDQGLLTMSPISIDSVDTGAVMVRRADPPAPSAGAPDQPAPATPTWVLPNAAAGESVDQAAADTLVSAIAQLRITGLLDAAPQLDTPELTLRVGTNNGVLVYRVAKQGDSDDYALRVTGQDRILAIAGWAGDGLLNGAGRDVLVKKAAPAADAGNAN